MAGVGLGGFFSSDPNPNPFQDIIPPGGAVLGENGEPLVDDPTINEAHFADDEGYDPPTGNGILAPILRPNFAEQATRQPNSVLKKAQYAEAYGASKLDVLRSIEEDIRSLLLARKKLLTELKSERDEIDKRLNVSESVTSALDEMFPEILEREIENGVIEE